MIEHEAVVFGLPWPPSTLSPNARVHWRTLAAAKKKYRRACWGETLKQRVRLPEHDGKFTLELQFAPPNKRRLDVDGLISRAKAGIDGVCDALQIDDSRFASVTGSITEKFQTVGAVWVRIKQA